MGPKLVKEMKGTTMEPESTGVDNEPVDVIGDRSEGTTEARESRVVECTRTILCSLVS